MKEPLSGIPDLMFRVLSQGVIQYSFNVLLFPSYVFVVYHVISNQ